MKTLKKWVKIDNSIFTLWDNDQKIGTMKMDFGGFQRKATASFQDQEIVIKTTGFWKSNLEIIASSGQIIAKVYSEKWYSSSYILEYDNKKYKLIVRNNPLAEWVLQEDYKNLLSYGLSTHDGKSSVKITTEYEKSNYIFDFILWYLFVSIATEQSGEDSTFLLLVS